MPALERLRAWLQTEGVTHVAMESTGSYWIPIFNILEGQVVIVLANPEEVKNRKGTRRTGMTLNTSLTCFDTNT